MPRIAIFAYGSLIEEPGEEICPLIRNRIRAVSTPFRIEFARSSKTRCHAPTLIPVDHGGSSVNGVLLVLDSRVALPVAKSLLWRRETRREFSGEQYTRPSNPGRNHVLVECIENFRDFDAVLYTKICSNITKLDPDHLADLAISSARGKAGASRKDGISYLASVKRQGIATPLLPSYLAAILQKTQARDLDEAYTRIREGFA